MAFIIQRWLALPNFVDEEERRVGGILRILLVMLFAASLVIIAVSTVYQDWHVVGALTLGVFALMAALWLLHRAHLRLAVFVALTTFLIVITYLLTLGQGVHDIGVLAIPILIIVGSLLLGKRGFLVFMVLCTGAIAVIVYSQVNPVGSSGLSRAWSDLIIVEITLIATAVAARLLADNLLQSIARARQSEQALSASYDQLQRHAVSLEASEARWRSLVENAPDLVLTVARDGTIKFSNDATLPGPGLVVGQSFFQFIEPRQHAEIRKLMDHVFTEAESESYEVQTLDLDNTRRWYSTRFGPVVEDGAVTSLTLIATNITERKQAEALQERYTQRVEILHEIDGKILAAHSINEIAAEVLRGMHRLVPYDWGSVTLFDFKTNLAQALAVNVDGRPDPTAAQTYAIDTAWAASLRDGQPLVIGDVVFSKMPGEDAGQLLQPGLRSELVAPLLHHGELIGSLNMGATQPNTFTAADREAANEVADHLAIAIQQARLFNETTEALQREQRLGEVAYVISSDLELQAIMPNIVRLAVELVGAQAGSLALLTPDGETVTFPYTYHIPAELQRSSFRRGQGLVWQVINGQASVSVDDYPAHPQAVPGWVAAGIHAFLSVPLMVGDLCLGALGLFGLDPAQRFSARDQAVAEAVGRQAAIAIQHARLFQAEQHRVELLTALHQTGLNLSDQLELPVLLGTIVERASSLAQASMGSLYLFEPDGESLRLVVGHNLQPDYAVSPVHPGEGVAGRVAQTGRPLVIHDYEKWPGRVASVPKTAFHSVLGVPIQWEGRALGVINVLDETVGHFGQAEMETVRLFAAHAAVAIQNAQLFQSTRRQLSELSILHAVAVAAAQAADEDELIGQATTIIGETLFPDYCGVLLVDQASGVLRVHNSQVGEAEPQTGPLPLGQGISGLVAENGRAWRIGDVRQEPAYLMPRSGMLSELCVPLKVGDKVLGVINVESAALEAFSDADERLLTTLAGQLAIAIERLRTETALRQLNAELEQRVMERTSELNVANQELEAFSYSVSHDLRTPLRSISGFSQILLDDYGENLDEVGRNYVRTVLEQCQHMANLIDDLLNLSRVTRAQLRRGKVNLSQLSEATLGRLRQAQPERQVECLVAPGLSASGDQNLLQIALENLIANAWKFTGKVSSARIEVGLMHEADGTATYFVRDNGAGFDMAYADKLFGAFERLHSQREFSGTGVGLAIVQRIIKRHGGRVWAEGVVNGGATFFFTLSGEAA